ncbi:MAG: hypothetical protein ACYC1C_11720, partial [Chloroflexota bacterium]
IWGANGRGKTSLTDAIQWLLLGSIPRLDALRFRKNEEHIVNTYALPEGRRASVEAVLALPDGSEFRARRAGDYRESVLDVETPDTRLVGEEAEQYLRQRACGTNLDQSEFRRYVLSMAILQQDVVRAFLADEPADKRYVLLSRLLGLGVIDEFVDSLSNSIRVLAERERAAESGLSQSERLLDSLRTQKNELEARIAVSSTYSSLDNVLDALVASPSPLSNWARAHLGSDQIHEASNLLGELRNVDADTQLLTSLIGRIDEVYAQEPAVPLAEAEEALRSIIYDIAELRNLAAVAERALAEAQKGYGQARAQLESLQDLASLAIPLLSEHCPVCGQRIDSEAVAARLNSMLGDSSLLEREKARCDEAEEHLNHVRDALLEAERWRAEREDLCRRSRQWRELLHQNLAAGSAAMDRMTAAGLEVPLALSSLADEAPTADSVLSAEEWLGSLSRAVRAAITSLQQAASAESLDIRRSQLAQVNSQIERAVEGVGVHQATLQFIQTDVESLKMLSADSRSAASEVVKETFDELEPVVQDLFARLSPHPTFRHLSLEHQVYRGKGTSVPTARDEDANREINPAVVFSSGQSNVAALCYFLGFAFAGGDINFPFVILDDPIQSMDDINVLGFADLCRFLRREKQLIVTTHDDRLASLLIRKLTPRISDPRSLSVQFVSWDRSGPRVELRELQPEDASFLFTYS